MGTLFVSMVAVWALALTGLSAFAPTQAWAAVSITRAQYDAIKNDATKVQVEELLGTLGAPQWITPRYVDCHNPGSTASFYGYRLSSSESEFGGADIIIQFRDEQSGPNVGYGWNSYVWVFYPFCVNHSGSADVITGTAVTLTDDIWRGERHDSITIPSMVVDGALHGQWYPVDDGVISRAKLLRRLDVSLAPAVKWVSAGCTEYNCRISLAELILGKKPQMTKIELSGSPVANLDLAGAPALQALRLESNDRLTALNLSNNAALTTIYAPDNRIAGLDLTHNPLLEELQAPDNALASVAFGSKSHLTFVDLEHNLLTGFTTAGAPNLAFLNVARNRLTTIDVRPSKALKSLSVGGNALSKLSLSSNKKLLGVSAEKNPRLKKINLSKLTKLTTIEWSYKLAKRFLPKKLKKAKPHKMAKYHYLYHR
jgi:hypothetical protein